MRIVLAPFSGETDDRAALADAAHGPQPFPAHAIGLCVSPGPGRCDRHEGVPAETVQQGMRWAGASRNERTALARQISARARTSADAALADRRTGAAMATGDRQEVIGSVDVLRARHGRRGMPVLVGH